MAEVTDGAVIGVTVVILLCGVGGIVACVILGKEGLLMCASEEKKQSFSQLHSYGFLSSEHAAAQAFFFFYVLFSTVAPFFSSLIIPSPSCLVTQIFMMIGVIGAKTAQYVFYISRLDRVYEKSNLPVSERLTKFLYGVVAVFLLGMDGTGVSMINTNGLSTVSSPSYTVCTYAPQGFNVPLFVHLMVFVLSDTVIMLTVAYQCIWRLLSLAESNSSDSTRKIAFQSAGMAALSKLSSILALIGHMTISNENMANWLIPHLDCTVNIVLVYIQLNYVLNSEWLQKQQWQLEMAGAKVKSNSGIDEKGQEE